MTEDICQSGQRATDKTKNQDTDKAKPIKDNYCTTNKSQDNNNPNLYEKIYLILSLPQLLTEYQGKYYFDSPGQSFSWSRFE